MANIIESTHESQRAEDDLNAQKDMARWALWMLVASAVTSAVTGAGVYYVALTLGETRIASAAATAAVKITKESAEKQLRAYLLPEKTSFLKVDSGNLSVGVVLKNTGQTPANNIRGRVHCGVIVQGENYSFPVDDGLLVGTIGPGQTYTQRYIQDLGNASAERGELILQGRMTFFVWGRVEYLDVFNQPRSSTFRYQWDAESDGFTQCEGGNYAT